MKTLIVVLSALMFVGCAASVVEFPNQPGSSDASADAPPDSGILNQPDSPNTLPDVLASNDTAPPPSNDSAAPDSSTSPDTGVASDAGNDSAADAGNPCILACQAAFANCISDHVCTRDCEWIRGECERHCTGCQGGSCGGSGCNGGSCGQGSCSGGSCNF